MHIYEYMLTSLPLINAFPRQDLNSGVTLGSFKRVSATSCIRDVARLMAGSFVIDGNLHFSPHPRARSLGRDTVFPLSCYLCWIFPTLSRYARRRVDAYRYHYSNLRYSVSLGMNTKSRVLVENDDWWTIMWVGLEYSDIVCDKNNVVGTGSMHQLDRCSIRLVRKLQNEVSINLST